MTSYEQIFSDFKQGNIRSFYEKMYPEMLVYTARLLGEEFAFLAEDCVQEAVLKAYQQHTSFLTPLQWKVFLYTCVRNKAISILRKGQAQHHYMEDKENETDDNLLLDIIEQETLSLLYEAIDSLPEKYRKLFELSFEQGLKNIEVAEMLSVAEVTVKKQKARLIELLREQLKGKIDDTSLMLLLFILSTE